MSTYPEHAVPSIRAHVELLRRIRPLGETGAQHSPVRTQSVGLVGDGDALAVVGRVQLTWYGLSVSRIRERIARAALTNGVFGSRIARIVHVRASLRSERAQCQHV